jgi:hypothetical protein
MNIRSEQMRAFDAGAWNSFETRAIRHLRANLPSQTERETETSLRQRIRTGTQRARIYGLASERQIMCFIDSSFLLGEQFDTDPNYYWTRHILEARDVDPNRRAAVLLDRAQTVAAGRPVDEGVAV